MLRNCQPKGFPYRGWEDTCPPGVSLPCTRAHVLAMAHMTRGVVGKGRERAAAAAGAGALPHKRRVVRTVPPLGVRALPLPLPLPCSRAQLAVLCALCSIRCEAG